MSRKHHVIWTDQQRNMVVEAFALATITATKTGKTIGTRKMFIKCQKQVLPMNKIRPTYPSNVKGLITAVEARVEELSKKRKPGSAMVPVPTAVNDVPRKLNGNGHIVPGPLSGASEDEIMLLKQDVQMSVTKLAKAVTKNVLSKIFTDMAGAITD